MDSIARTTVVLSLAFAACSWAKNAEVEFKVVDKATGRPIAVRMHLKNVRGVARRARKTPFYHDHFVFFDRTIVSLPAGVYQFEVERGPEYKRVFGNLTIRGKETDNKTIEMERFVDMKKDGWWSGDVHVERSPRVMRLLMLAEDLHVAPVISWSNKRHRQRRLRIRKADFGPKLADAGSLFPVGTNRFFHLENGKDLSGGGVLLLLSAKPLRLGSTSSEYPPSMEVLEVANQDKLVTAIAEKPYWWDLPTWLANGRVHAICIANDHIQRGSVTNHEAWGVKRPAGKYPPPHGNGRWAQNLYYKVLECGLRVPPAAGSGSGHSINPLGYNRVYVQCGPKLDYQQWWEHLRRGRVLITNGPMIRPLVNGKYPGHIFRANQGQTVALQPTLQLAIRDPVSYLEIVKNGEVVRKVRLADYVKKRGQLDPITFEHSGWMLIRAVSSRPKTYRYATTAPYYVQIGKQRRVSKSAAEFFVTWVQHRIANLKKSRYLRAKTRRAAVLKHHEKALAYWQKLVDQSTAP